MVTYVLDEKQRDETVKKILCRLRDSVRQLQKVLSLPVFVDYENWVRERSIKIFGEVKDFYTPQETAKLLGVHKSTIYYRCQRGLIKTLAGRIPFSEIVLLAEYYRTKDLLEELENVVNGGSFNCLNRANQ